VKDKVLLIDDDDIICEIVPEMFDAIDVVAFTAKNLREATTLLNEKQNEIKMILFDMNLEGITGIEIFHELKRINPEFVAILATGDHVDKNYAVAKETGFDEVIQKPFSIATLIQLKEKYIDCK
jgi:DNA-binding NtrC family response regulator